MIMMNYPVLDPKAIGGRIRELRKERGLRVEDIRDFMGFESDQAIYKWQRGESLPTLDNMYALSKLLGTTVEFILAGEREREEDFGPLLPRYKDDRDTAA